MIFASILFYAACVLFWLFALLMLTAWAVGAFMLREAFRDEVKRDDTDWQDHP